MQGLTYSHIYQRKKNKEYIVEWKAHPQDSDRTV